MLLTSFDTKQYDRIAVCLGFYHGINASVVFDEATLSFGYNKKKNKKLRNANALKLVSLINRQVNISEFTKDNINGEIIKIASFINELLLDTFNIKKMFYDENNSYMPLYFKEFLLSDDTKKTNSFCQKCSLSLSEVLEIYNIKSRQLHFKNENGAGFHQFVEYFNPFIQKWIIIDPFYGVQYSLNNHLGGSKEMIEINDRNEFSEDLIIRLNMKNLYYSWDELKAGWNSKLQGGLSFPRENIISLEYSN